MLDQMFKSFNGVRITEDINMVVPGEPYEKQRTLKERLFSLPWRPLKKTKTITPMVPSKEIICWENQFVMHPATKQAFLQEMAKAEFK